MQMESLTWLSAPNLKAVHHGFSTRQGGVSQGALDSLNLRLHNDDIASIHENYRRFCATLGVDVRRSVLSHQVHQDTIRLVTNEDAGKGLFHPRDYEADGLITNVAQLPLVVFSADCGILLFHDPVHQAIGAVHAGWRGCAMGIVEKVVQEMTTHFGTNPADLQVCIGPCIGQCCFETDSDVPESMVKALGVDADAHITQQGTKYHVDLAGLNRTWLLKAGVLPQHIETSPLCTACHPELFWSHRKMGDARGVQCGLISLPASL